MIQVVLNYHIEIIVLMYLMFQIGTLYFYYFRTNKNTDSIDLMKRYVKRRM